jgi:thiol-disulfide isomerase/thioredoxin
MAERWRPGSPPVTAADLPAVLASGPVVVIHFWAAWNGVDRLFEPQFAAVRREFEGRIAFRSADVDEPDLEPFCRESGVVNVPALGCFVRGRRVKTIIGARPEDELRAEFIRLVGDNGRAEPGSVLSTDLF